MSGSPNQQMVHTVKLPSLNIAVFIFKYRFLIELCTTLCACVGTVEDFWHLNVYILVGLVILSGRSRI